MTAGDFASIAAVVTVAAIFATALGKRGLDALADADDAQADAWGFQPDGDLEAARLHDRFVDCLDVAADALACYAGQCRTNVRDGDDEFDREHFAREARRADEARKVVVYLQSRRPVAP